MTNEQQIALLRDALTDLVEWAEAYRAGCKAAGERPLIDAARVRAGRKALDRTKPPGRQA